ncbi:MAG: SMP-30/gluconolactonase/LRE family protein [Betaproteobacteria bacterium]|nr:MAG: SMP-30/gluconolactonase/LRE family protein [Betaproteobacteria bacterium]
MTKKNLTSLSAALVFDARATLGECPRWDAEAQCLYWVDINGNALHRFDPATGTNESMDIGQNIGCFAQDQRGGFIAGLRSGYARISEFGGAVIALTSPNFDPVSARFNDGRCDGQGRFWAGTMWGPRDRAGGTVYRLDADGRFSAQACPTVITNGITFSPDGKTMTLADTPSHELWAFDYDEATGTPSNRRVLRTYDPPTGRPDGACVDADGNVYVAIFQGGRVEKLSPSGELLTTIIVPAPNPTCCTFGGPDLRTLYITTARTRMSEEELAAMPEAGGIYAARIDAPHAPGIVEPRYAG